MTVTSNLQAVLDRVKRQPRDIRAALTRTLAPAEWDRQLRAEAKATLWALAKPNGSSQQPSSGLRPPSPTPVSEGLVESFVQTIMVAPYLTGFLSRMSNPLPPVLYIEDFMMAQGLQTKALNTGRGPTLFSDFLNQFDQMMVDWVATEKNKDARDWSKSDEDVGHFMGYLMLTPDGKLNPKELAAKKKLLPHLTEYVMRKQMERRLDTDTINAWLLAVLAAWSALVQREFPGKFRGHLNAVRSEL